MALVLLDLDGTLVDQAGAARAWADEFVESLGLPDSARVDIAAQLAQRRPKGEIFDAIARTWSLPVSGGDLWASYRGRMPQLVRCSDADRRALKDLGAAGWTLGIVTNGMIDNQRGKILTTGLADLVDGWVISEEVGYRKPDSRIFTALAKRLGCALDGWMIGDSVEDDIVGGSAIGLSTALIARSGSAVGEAVAAPTITSVSVADAASTILAGAHD